MLEFWQICIDFLLNVYNDIFGVEIFENVSAGEFIISCVLVAMAINFVWLNLTHRKGD